ncbi:hypothetical protein E0H26_05725 [Micromonospora zingiberis]|uniref:Uncharacterized protein n=1 Tax=Micromonospora zingiberis TaxID=2053011 RepID=A0A4V2LX40_9ACTN|nr:hypothetical protein [Micromonospora zingiberis]TCB98915.1 hypothetical protein E0H26_05725 [Micromonospora zingiberis]
MRRFPDARTVAVVAAVAACWLLASLVAGRRQDLLGVAMALLCVLLATVAGVAVAAARQHDAEAVPDPAQPPGSTEATPPGVDADTLETLGDREAVRAMRARYRRDDQ